MAVEQNIDEVAHALANSLNKRVSNCVYLNASIVAEDCQLPQVLQAKERHTREPFSSSNCRKHRKRYVGVELHG